MFYYLYEIKNNVNGKIYVGVHKTKVVNDGYMGSGKVLAKSVHKHGIKNFTKTILEHFDSAEAMYAREKEVVNEEFLNRDDTYNLRRGGSGGFDYINKKGLNWSEIRRNTPVSDSIRKKISKSRNLGFSSGKLDYLREIYSKNMSANNPMFETTAKELVADKLRGIPKSEEHKRNMSVSHKTSNKRFQPDNKGRKYPDRKQRLSVEYKSVVCPHCEKEGKSNVMGRWHFENCKLYPGRSTG